MAPYQEARINIFPQCLSSGQVNSSRTPQLTNSPRAFPYLIQWHLFPLAQYGVIFGFGIFYAVLINAFTWIQKKYSTFDPTNIEEFSSASRSIKPGLLTVSVVSAWTWAAVFLQTGTLTYLYGVSLPWWFACGGFIEICFFSFAAISVKANARTASTFVQVAKIRFGKLGHAAFLLAALIANFVVGSEILVGGAGVIAGLTGVSSYAPIWLLPFVVVLYVFFGGLRASFIADYLHCVVLFTCLLVLVLSTYSGSAALSSPARLYDLVVEAAARAPVVGNHDGSYLTWASEGGKLYVLIATFNNYGLSFTDQSYWQRAIAARSKGMIWSFLLGGFAFGSIAFASGMSMGLAARALETSSHFPIYPRAMSAAEIGAGLAAPYASMAILGGPVLYILIAFQATTSAFSAQLVAVSSLFTYDIFQTYIRPTASNETLLRVSHIFVVGWAIFMAMICSVWIDIGLDLNFLFYCTLFSHSRTLLILFEVMGVATSGAVVPIFLTMSWRRLNKFGAVGGVFSGIGGGLTAWLVAAKTLEGSISVTTLQANHPILAGGCTALGLGGAVAILSSLIAPSDFRFEDTPELIHVVNGRADTENPASEKDSVQSPNFAKGSPTADLDGESVAEVLAERRKLLIILVVVLLIIYIIIPVPIAASHTIYKKGLFVLGCVVAVIWLFISIFIVFFWPIIESRNELVTLIGRIRRGEKN